MSTLRLGTRGSELALVQARMIAAALQSHGVPVEIHPIKTSGDKKQSNGYAASDKKEWILEIERELSEARIDFAVHSAKDVPLDIEPGTTVIPLLPRALAHDVIIFQDAVGYPCSRLHDGNLAISPLAYLARGATVGTSSLRRRAQLLHVRSDLNVVPLRGNVPTRLAKLDDDLSMSAIVLAAAGLARLGIDRGVPLDLHQFVPGVNQGILAVQYCTTRTDVRAFLGPHICRDTRATFAAERAVIAGLGADCNSAVGAYAVSKGDVIEVQGMVLRRDGREKVVASSSVALENAVTGGDAVAKDLVAQGALTLLRG